jgi:amino acid transporter
MFLVDAILGRPLASDEEKGERISTLGGVPTFGLDALSSAAYGPEAALSILIPLGAAGLGYALPLMGAIIVVLALVYLSYRQTIAAYPEGAGSYTVAHANLGQTVGLLAGAALMTDYILNVAVGISAGVGAIISAAPSLQPHTLSMCLAILVFLTIVNLRGVRQPGILFMLPTVVFVCFLFGVIAWGVYQSIVSGGHPRAVTPPPHIGASATAASAWLLMRAFASGCTSMTGVEATSNGVQAFAEPVVKSAQRSLAAIIAILMLLLAGIAYLVQVYHIGATAPGTSSYESVLSQLIGAVAGKGILYWIGITAIAMVVCLSANTSFADFPRLCRAVAADRYLPVSLANRGRRLVYSEGILVLAGLAAVILTAFGGVTDRLIPLFAVGAFLAFTSSQAGMVAHWWRHNGPRTSMAFNGLGAGATAATTIVVIIAKFVEGAWMVVLLIPALMLFMIAVRRYYDAIDRETAAGPLKVTPLCHPLVVVPISQWSVISQKALQFAMTISDEVTAIHVESEQHADTLPGEWRSRVEEPTRRAGRKAPRLAVVKSPYRFVVGPIIDFILDLERHHPQRTVAVVLPQLVQRRWYHYFLHNHQGELMAALLLLKGERRVVIVDVPWYIGH